ncbi:peroxin-1 [Monoraphidium neglectum]|uniref:Peroxin-1 n=1 Tax=Monoraphidium neglectum TaxID=145388 RepID=A0A0D2LQD4_9CHLO|nr:peroxin-1 [Monoraphidium neglectum]KIY92136.1 peroxin-1 [Monoraphidium neglectum]|eukprot:XP_013891156.1 peroxin-1 [Monoraphidium neglectum]
MSGFSRLPLHVDLVPERGSWIALPPTLAAQLLDAGAELPLIVQLVPLDAIGAPAQGARPLFAAWQGSTLPSEGALGVPAALANCLGLRRGAPVQLRPLAGVPAAEAVIVEPLSGDDWEVLELNAGHLEDQLLEQVGVVAPGQALTMWARQAPARLLVTSLLPEGLAVARLAPGTEVHIAPKPRVGAAGGNGGGELPAVGGGGEAAAAAAAAEQAPRRVWLRVLEAGPERCSRG